MPGSPRSPLHASPSSGLPSRISSCRWWCNVFAGLLHTRRQFEQPRGSRDVCRAAWTHPVTPCKSGQTRTCAPRTVVSRWPCELIGGWIKSCLSVCLCAQQLHLRCSVNKMARVVDCSFSYTFTDEYISSMWVRAECGVRSNLGVFLYWSKSEGSQDDSQNGKEIEKVIVFSVPTFFLGK